LALAVAGIGALAVVQGLRPTTTTDETFTLNPGAAVLEVDVDQGEVLLTAGRDDRLQVRRTIRVAGTAPTLKQRADSNGASLRSRCPVLAVRGCSIRHEIAVPAGMTIDIAAGTGSVQVRGLVVENLQVDVSSGSAQLEDVSGPVEITSGSGSVAGTRLRTREIVTRVGSGSTSLDFARPPQRVAAVAVSGAVSVRLPAADGPYRVTATSASGDEDVQVPTDPASTHRIDISSGSGDVRVLPR
jgi:hypothetical protein